MKASHPNTTVISMNLGNIGVKKSTKVEENSIETKVMTIAMMKNTSPVSIEIVKKKDRTRISKTGMESPTQKSIGPNTLKSSPTFNKNTQTKNGHIKYKRKDNTVKKGPTNNTTKDPTIILKNLKDTLILDTEMIHAIQTSLDIKTEKIHDIGMKIKAKNTFTKNYLSKVDNRHKRKDHLPIIRRWMFKSIDPWFRIL